MKTQTTIRIEETNYFKAKDILRSYRMAILSELESKKKEKL